MTRTGCMLLAQNIWDVFSEFHQSACYSRKQFSEISAGDGRSAMCNTRWGQGEYLCCPWNIREASVTVLTDLNEHFEHRIDLHRRQEQHILCYWSNITCSTSYISMGLLPFSMKMARVTSQHQIWIFRVQSSELIISTTNGHKNKISTVLRSY